MRRILAMPMLCFVILQCQSKHKAAEMGSVGAVKDYSSGYQEAITQFQQAAATFAASPTCTAAKASSDENCKQAAGLAKADPLVIQASLSVLKDPSVQSLAKTLQTSVSTSNSTTNSALGLADTGSQQQTSSSAASIGMMVGGAVLLVVSAGAFAKAERIKGESAVELGTLKEAAVEGVKETDEQISAHESEIKEKVTLLEQYRLTRSNLILDLGIQVLEAEGSEDAKKIAQEFKNAKQQGVLIIQEGGKTEIKVGELKFSSDALLFYQLLNQNKSTKTHDLLRDIVDNLAELFAQGSTSENFKEIREKYKTEIRGKLESFKSSTEWAQFVDNTFEISETRERIQAIQREKTTPHESKIGIQKPVSDFTKVNRYRLGGLLSLLAGVGVGVGGIVMQSQLQLAGTPDDIQNYLMSLGKIYNEQTGNP